jgi:ankyrin repeat protein
MSTQPGDVRVDFIEAALWHGPLERANAILANHPDLSSRDLHLAAILGDDAAVKQFLETDPQTVTAQSPPYAGDALNYLCLSKYLRLDRARTDGFIRAARALLDAGADPNTGFWTKGQNPERETALYGAAGVAHHPEMTALLLEYGADPNDEEVVYHSPEGYDSSAMQLVVETRRVSPENLLVMLLRKHDWHDAHGVRYLLERGADPNLATRWPRPIHHAIVRDNSREIIELLLDHGADPTVLEHGRSAVAVAARRGRGDLLTTFARRGIPIDLNDTHNLIAACATNDAVQIRAMASRASEAVQEIIAEGGTLLAEFAGTWNTDGVRHLLDLGVPVDILYGGDGYFDIANHSTALHVAAWKAHPPTVRLLIERGAAVNARDEKNRTPLMLAVKACVDSYWTERRTPESVRLLLDAGASVDGVAFPSGYDAVDQLLRRAGADRPAQG